MFQSIGVGGRTYQIYEQVRFLPWSIKGWQECFQTRARFLGSISDGIFSSQVLLDVFLW
eukprot:TRINITY_DN15675_c0_g1_i1.p3 TRINITY_DN15675_c0_g1~~TRINITY_DN15675_c0_g1_i1.p3  ORF type:complete len:59 (+),score=5.12 TRINITY_DN15675_c0_g1_i1:345-521(+)